MMSQKDDFPSYYPCHSKADASALAAKSIKTECEAILEDAIPALSAAVAALDTIKAADIRLVQVCIML